MDEPCQEFRYRKPWPWLVAAGVLAVVALANGVWRASQGYPLAPHLAGTMSAVALIGLGIVLGGIALAAARAVLRPAAIVLSETTLSIPRSRFSTHVVPLAWDQISTLRTADLGDEQQLELIWPEGQLRIVRSLLKSPDEFASLQAALTERLGHLGVPVEESSALERKRRFRPQFSLAYLFLVTTFVAALFGTHRYSYGSCGSDIWLELAITMVILLAVPWLTASLPRAVWTVAVGFAVGFLWEGLVAVVWISLGWLQFSSSPGAAGWYPLTAAVWRLASRLPALAWLAEGLRAYLLAAVLSGILGGFAALALRRLGPRLPWRQPVSP